MTLRRPVRAKSCGAPMWDDARQLNAIAAAARADRRGPPAVGRGRVGRAPAARSRSARSSSAVRSSALSATHLEAVIRDELAGTFFTMNLDARARVARAGAVGAQRRAAPPVAAAARGHASRSTCRSRAGTTSALVNAQGEVFVADYDGELPQFDGPDGAVAEVAARYPRMGRGARAARRSRSRASRLSPRGGWQLVARGDGRHAGDRARARRAGGAARALRRGRTAARSGALARVGHAHRARGPALPQRIRGARAGIPRARRRSKAAAERRARRATATPTRRRWSDGEGSKNVIVGLDIGTSKIVAIVAEVDRRTAASTSSASGRSRRAA